MSKVVLGFFFQGAGVLVPHDYLKLALANNLSTRGREFVSTITYSRTVLVLSTHQSCTVIIVLAIFIYSG